MGQFLSGTDGNVAVTFEHTAFPSMDPFPSTTTPTPIPATHPPPPVSGPPPPPASAPITPLPYPSPVTIPPISFATLPAHSSSASSSSLSPSISIQASLIPVFSNRHLPPSALSTTSTFPLAPAHLTPTNPNMSRIQNTLNQFGMGAPPSEDLTPRAHLLEIEIRLLRIWGLLENVTLILDSSPDHRLGMPISFVI